MRGGISGTGIQVPNAQVPKCMQKAARDLIMVAQKRGKLMQADQRGSHLSALFVDYDNVYLSLKRRNEDAAARFAQEPERWLGQIISGRLVRGDDEAPRRKRMAVNRVYGNPVPRRGGRDGPNDPNSFIFVRHHFIRSGFEVVDCPPLTAQLKNGSDIRMAIDIRDFLEHRTRFDEFIILSGDADFTPVLHRLRSFDRRTVIYSNDHTAAPYAALSDGRIEEMDLVNFLLNDALPSPRGPSANALGYGDGPGGRAPQGLAYERGARTASLGGPLEEPAVRALMEDFRAVGSEIVALVINVLDASDKPVPIAFLANQAMKELGHPKTVGTNWAGCGGFLNFLSQNLPDSLRLSETPPHRVYDPRRHQIDETPAEQPGPVRREPQAAAQPAGVLAPAQNASSTRLSELQNSIARIYEASKAPPLPPSEYQLLFNLISREVLENGFHPERTVSGVLSRAAEHRVRLATQDVAFVVAAIDEMDPWLEQSQTPAAIARAYRENILGRCKAAGVALTDDEHQLVHVWFGATQWKSSDESGGSDPGGGPPPGRASSGGIDRFGADRDAHFSSFYDEGRGNPNDAEARYKRHG